MNIGNELFLKSKVGRFFLFSFGIVTLVVISTIVAPLVIFSAALYGTLWVIFQAIRKSYQAVYLKTNHIKGGIMNYEEEWIRFEIYKYIGIAKGRLSHSQRRLSGGDLAAIDLSGKNMNEAQIDNVDLSGADLEKACLLRANLAYSDLGNANLKTADLRQSNLCFANLEAANLKGADLAGAYFNQQTQLPFTKSKAKERGMVFLRTAYSY